MEYERRQYFREHDDPTVSGFTIIETSSGSRPDDGSVPASEESYRVAEKWERESGSQWVDYWVPEEKLVERVENEQCEPVANVSDDQFEQICERTDIRALQSEKVIA